MIFMLKLKKITFPGLTIWMLILQVFMICSCNKNANIPKGVDNGIPRLFLELPDFCPTPDAFSIAPDGSLILSCPNYAEKSVQGTLVKIDKDRSVINLGIVPGIKPGTYGTPMGIDHGPDGALYVCVNQGPDNGSILKMTFKQDSLVKTEVVAKGINGPNGLKVEGQAIFVTTPKLPKITGAKNTSGVYRFSLSDRNVQINNDQTDPNLIFTVQTQNPIRQFGLDGLTFDSKGNLVVGDFGDGTIYSLKLSKKGSVIKEMILADLPDSTGIDGMMFDRKDNLYVVGFSQNQLWKIDKKGNSKIIAQSPDNNGEKGGLDQPVDLVFYNNKLLISNFDLMTDADMVNTSHDKPYTISYMEL